MSQQYYFTDPSGKILGPTDFNNIKTYVETGHVDATVEICCEDETVWTSYYKVAAELEKTTDTQPAKPDVEVPTPTTAEKPVVNDPIPKGLSTKDLLNELKEKMVTMQCAGESTVTKVTIENVGEDLITLASVEDANIFHMPLSRLFRIVENIDSVETHLEFK